MTLTEILEQIRSVYVAEFAARLAGYPADVNRALLAQALYLDTEGEPLRTGTLQLPARGDVCVLREQRVQEIACIESSRLVRFDAFRFVWANRLQVAMNPFVWSNCSLCIPEPIDSLELNFLVKWFEKQVQASELAGSSLEVVHSVTAPRAAVDGVRFEVDFGSMPVTGFEAFLDACTEMGAGLLVVGNVVTDSV